MWTIVLMLFACTSSEEAPSNTAGSGDTATVEPYDTDNVITIDTGNAGGLTGTVPTEALEAPDFTATHYDRSKRNKSDLLGQATVMWFYPVAGTPG